MLKTGRFHKSVHLLISLALFAGLALIPAQPAYAATYTVDSLEDTNDGLCGGSDCTLREAIISANASVGVADTILFDLSGTITLTSSLPGILMTGGGLTIDGSGRSIRINGHDLYRVLSTQLYAHLTLKNLIIEEGYTTVMGSGGGGVYNHGELTVDSCTFRNNVAADHGGAIYNNGTLTITNSLLYHNSTQYLNGGAIYVYTGTVTTINESNFLYNDAGLDGGAIYNYGNLEIDDTGFSFNEASDGSGGAIYNRADLEIQDGTFSANLAYFDGGAFYNKNGTRNFHIYDSVFNYNIAWRDGGGAFISSTFAGSRFESCTFFQNSALNDGGGLRSAGGNYSMYNTIIKDNEADRDGGGIYNGDSHNSVELYLDDMTIESNTAAQDGGGIYNIDKLSLSYSTVNGNQADRNGGGLYSDSVNEFKPDKQYFCR